ncbi:hypothetical protein [Spirosoma pulveris]
MTFDWDEYFDRKQNLLFNVWVSAYEKQVASARHNELASFYYAMPYRTIKIQTNPFDGLNLSSNEDEEVFNHMEANFFKNVFESFKMRWLLTTDQPVTRFIYQDLLNIVHLYLVNLFLKVNDWDMVEKADALANAFISNRRLIKKSILRWLVRGFAAECMEHYLENKLTIFEAKNDLLDLLDTINVSDYIGVSPKKNSGSIVTEQNSLDKFIDGHLKSVKTVLPKREKTIENHLEIYSDYLLYINKGFSPTISIQMLIND